MVTPRSTYEYDLVDGQRTLLKAEPVLGGFDVANYRTEFVHATARDGTRVPVSLAYRKDTRLDGSAPLYQYAYGSYGYSTDPVFRSNWVSLLDRGFVVAIAHIRGGQELGRAWYEDGKLLKKMNTFTDFIDCTRWLVAQRYAAPDRVFAAGGSAGGLLMGAVANLAPQDYRGIVAYVPFVDVVTTMLDESIPLTTKNSTSGATPSRRRTTTTCSAIRRTTTYARKPIRQCWSSPACGTARCSTTSRPSGSHGCGQPRPINGR